MKTSGRCPKCDSRELAIDARILDREDSPFLVYDLTAETYEKPGALVFKGRTKFNLKACICLSCGFTEIYSAREKP